MGNFWGPHFPDAAGIPFTVPAVAATLALAPSVTNSGSFENVVLRARVAPGNGIQVKFADDALSSAGEIEEDLGLGQVTIRFISEVTTAGDIANLINTASVLIEMVGVWNPTDFAFSGDDEFDFLDLEHGIAAIDGVQSRFWGPHFPDGADVVIDQVSPTGPETVATFALKLETGVSITYSWETDVFKAYDGSERRASTLEDPKQSYQGTALLLDGDSLDVRSQIARYAALGRPFLLGLPFEEVTIPAEADGFTVPVASTDLLDWALPGQRVIVFQSDGDYQDAVIQAVGSDEIDLNVAPAFVAGGRVQPAVAVLLEPQQGFARYPNNAEAWQINARAATFGFTAAAIPAQVSLDSPLTASGLWGGIFIRAKTAGADGNDITIAFNDDAIEEVVVVDDGTGPVTVRFLPGVTTVGEIHIALATFSTLVKMVGVDASNQDGVLESVDDEFAATPLTGGADSAPGEMGIGAELAMYGTRIIFDRYSSNEGTASDSVQAMSEVVDMGGVPFGVGSATIPDWGRQVLLESSSIAEWQWLKLFLATVRGRHRAFLLPTWREDLLAIGNGPGGGGTTGNITISSTVGDFFAWFTTGHTFIRVKQASGVYWLEIATATDNGDGTITLAVVADTGETVPTATAIQMISWLELARLESDDITVMWSDRGFSMKTNARVVQR